jgi:ComF family protein
MVDAARAWLGGLCEVCRGWQAGGVCQACQARFAAHRPRCQTCALPVPDGVPRCGACLHDPPPFERCVCAVDYVFPWDRLVTRLKFAATPELAQVLSTLLVRAARQQAADTPELLVPAPLSAQRLADRGYDQAWELARRLGSALQVPALPRALVRRFDSRQQTSLSRRERQVNLRGAFTVPVAQRAHVAGRHVGLVDDVMTTGATAHEAASALLAAGARRVDLWVAARTPAPDADA